MITFVCWKWGEKYTSAHVNTLAQMVDRWYGFPHFICVTDDPKGIDGGIEIVPDRADFAGVASPHGKSAPSCYRRLRAFAPDAAETFGERFVCLDLDTVIVGDPAPLWERDEDFVIWQDPLYPTQGCGSMFMLKAGSCPQVWTEFSPESSPRLANAARYRGSDQAWLSYMLPRAPRWTRDDGAYSFRLDCKNGLPDNARIVFFHGAQKQDDLGMPAWVRNNYH